MKHITGITCACSNGLGSSMIVSMNVSAILKQLGIQGIEVRHCPISEAAAHPHDLFIVGSDLLPMVKGQKHVIVLKDLISRSELEEKLKTAFARGDEPYLIQ